jgi:hypothetical protein
VTRTLSAWIPLTAIGFAILLAACGGSSGTGTTPTAGGTAPAATAAPPTATAALPGITAASAACPSGSSVSSALGTSGLPNAVGVAPPASTSEFPAGATGIVCEYHATTANVIIEVIMNIPGSYISAYSSHFPAGFQTVPGVGDQARSFHQTLGGGKDNEGVVATKGTTLVAVDATDTPATLGQIESLVSSLL